jgi:hypothetical protein
MRKTKHTAGATLSFRPDEVRAYRFDELPDVFGTFYAVTLLDSPPWPEGDVSPQCKPFVVACIQFAEWGSHMFPSWGWVHLDPDARAIIGEDLEEIGAPPGKWIYMIIEPDQPQGYEFSDSPDTSEQREKETSDG